ncbi:P-loop containing nucleoside triphosphate hydrolase protein [Crepidotus variabilis]|uniref:RNA helicase n=1 Tax=Crepidotus variabilis TaxID=179855 RepID=A0A9P6ELD6_9AGAR|nr:P-loop containing nucleoside triphosphate hydrolase protein [Crepidotus variabilis]
MPPKKGIVKSGNAGNSSKASSSKETLPASNEPVKPPPLFPPGSKWPLSLLQERCQKQGWEKPIVDTRQHGKDGFSFVVTLAWFNTKTSQRETVRMEPHPPYYRPTAMEAKHWGATYALYRFCNGIQLNRVLPPGPRDYWNELANEHKSVEEHRKWMYEPDPFAAKRGVEERQAAAQSAREGANSSKEPDRSRPPQNSSSNYPEVIMATSLRELVEDAIKQGFALYPDANDDAPLALTADSASQVGQQLGRLGFNKKQIKDVTQFLSEDSQLATTLLNVLSPLEAAIEYLVLHVPECDLPNRFMPSKNSSNPFITSAHSGASDLKRRWIEDKAVMEAGWPLNAVKECITDQRLVEHWDLLLVTLGQKLIGKPVDYVITNITEGLTAYVIDQEEYEALGASLFEPGHLVLPLFSVDVSVHILFSEGKYPRPGYMPIYLSSATIPAYVRLHLLAQFIQAMEAQVDLEVGDGFCMALMRIIEGAWAPIEDNGPPDMSKVLEHVIAPSQKFKGKPNEARPTQNKKNKIGPTYRRPVGTDVEIRQELEAMRKKDKFQELLRVRQKLPAFSVREEFLNVLEKNRVVVVVGETGCGKTTQLPQFILDSLITSNRGAKASIVVTQPRRLSAISVAARVSDERLNDGSVGYTIRGESKLTKNTRLVFCTTGVVLRRLSSGDMLQDVTHVVVDEVHERSMDGDFLLLELKDLLKKHPTLKVVLMSATINHETFIKYFNGAPLLTIPGFAHPVTDKYLEDVLSSIEYRPQSTRLKKGEDPLKLKEMRDNYRADGLAADVVEAIQTLTRDDKIDYQLIASLVAHIVKTAQKRGGILIFLPGVNEIRQCIEAIQHAVSGHETVVLPLHANLSNNEQNKVFQPTKLWKIIAATNVAETSITIDDVIYVVDAGKVKETQYNPDTNLSKLVEVWVTRAAARQRRGRAGRTQPGVCYKLYTRKQEQKMIEFPVPEILRVPLESISLSVKASKENQDVKAFLSQAIDAPSLVSVDRAWKTLEEIGAVDDEGRLTALGKHISLLPMDVRLAKMLILGTIFQCLAPALTVVALLSSKPLFFNPIEKRDEASAARAKFVTGDSDLLTDVKAFDECYAMQQNSQPQGNIRRFCEENFISMSVLREISTLRQDFISALSEMGFIPSNSNPSSPSLNASSDNVNLVKAVILGGLWPRVARVHLPKENIKYDKVSAGTVQRENTAKDFKLYDLQEGRVFLHPGSVLFSTANWKPPFLTYFSKHMTSKIFLRDASKVPMYAILLFGGTVSVNHVRGGLTVGNKDNYIKLESTPRIGILVNQLRRLLDAQLAKCIEEGTMLTTQTENPVIHAILALLIHDGRTE